MAESPYGLDKTGGWFVGCRGLNYWTEFGRLDSALGGTGSRPLAVTVDLGDRQERVGEDLGDVNDAHLTLGQLALTGTVLGGVVEHHQAEWQAVDTRSSASSMCSWLTRLPMVSSM